MTVLAGLRLNSFRQDGLTVDPTLMEAEFLCWTSAELNYSVISATLPILRPLVTNLATHYGGGFGQSDGRTYADGSSGSYLRSRMRGDDSIQLQSFGHRKSDHVGHQVSIQKSQGESRYVKSLARGYTGAKRGSVIGEQANGDAISVGSSDSKKMIIRKDTTWAVQHDYESM